MDGVKRVRKAAEHWERQLCHVPGQLDAAAGTARVLLLILQKRSRRRGWHRQEREEEEEQHEAPVQRQSRQLGRNTSAGAQWSDPGRWHRVAQAPPLQLAAH